MTQSYYRAWKKDRNAEQTSTGTELMLLNQSSGKKIIDCPQAKVPEWFSNSKAVVRKGNGRNI